MKGAVACAAHWMKGWMKGAGAMCSALDERVDEGRITVEWLREVVKRIVVAASMLHELCFGR